MKPGTGRLSAELMASLRDKTVSGSIEYKHRINQALSAFAVVRGRYSPRGPDLSGRLGLEWLF